MYSSSQFARCLGWSLLLSEIVRIDFFARTRPHGKVYRPTRNRFFKSLCEQDRYNSSDGGAPHGPNGSWIRWDEHGRRCVESGAYAHG